MLCLSSYTQVFVFHMANYEKMIDCQNKFLLGRRKNSAANFRFVLLQNKLAAYFVLAAIIKILCKKIKHLDETCRWHDLFCCLVWKIYRASLKKVGLVNSSLFVLLLRCPWALRKTIHVSWKLNSLWLFLVYKFPELQTMPEILIWLFIQIELILSVWLSFKN